MVCLLQLGSNLRAVLLPVFRMSGFLNELVHFLNLLDIHEDSVFCDHVNYDPTLFKNYLYIFNTVQQKRLAYEVILIGRLV